MRNSTRALRKSSPRWVTWMPVNRNGGHRLRPWRRMRAENVRMRSGQQQRGHPAPVAADQVLVVEDAEGVDQCAPGQAVVEAAVAPQHFQELLEPGLGIPGDQFVHAEQ